MYVVQHHSYCGMSGIRHEFTDKGRARAEVAARLRRRRRNYPVVTLTRGREWEVQEPEGCVMVPDACGQLTLREEFKHECRECGCGYDDRDDAARCCNGEEH